MGALKDRVTIRVRDEMADMLTEIMQATPAASYTEVVRRSLKVYYKLAMAQEAGARLLVVTEDAEGRETRKPITL